MLRHSSPLLFMLAGLACADRRTEAPSEDSVRDTASVIGVQPTRPGIRFDPSVLRPRQRVGDLVVDSISAQRTIIDSTFVGSARFIGEVELTGRRFPHPDADLRVSTSCFEADSVSAARLPRWAADERRPWFCFANRAEAARAMGEEGADALLTIVIDRFTIHRNLSDAVNSAVFIRVVRADSTRG